VKERAFIISPETRVEEQLSKGVGSIKIIAFALEKIHSFDVLTP
jgi:hypothetical protein